MQQDLVMDKMKQSLVPDEMQQNLVLDKMKQKPVPDKEQENLVLDQKKQKLVPDKMQQNIGPSFIALKLGGGIASTYALKVNPSFYSVTDMS